MVDKELHLNENNLYKDQDNVPIKAKNNGDNTYSLAVSPSASSDFQGKEGMNTIVGEAIVGQRSDFVNILFEYNVGTYDTYQTLTGTGSLSHSNAKAVLGTGVGIGKALLRSKDPVRYVTGHEVNVETTCIFGSPEAGVSQKIGIGEDIEAFAGFGYDGTSFGVWLRTVDDGSIHIPQSSWDNQNVGNLNPQKFNIYKMTYGWYGILPIQFSIFYEGDWVLVHTYSKVNESENPHLANPTLPISAFVERESGSGGNIQLQTSSWRGGIVGEINEGVTTDRKFAIKTVTSITGANVPIYSIRSGATFQGQTNYVRIRLGTFTASSDGTKAVEIDVWKEGTLTGGTWEAFDADNSVAEFNNTATSFAPPAGRVSGGTVLGKVDRDRINLIEGDVIIPLYPGETIHFVGTTSSGTSDMVVFVRHIEEF